MTQVVQLLVSHGIDAVQAAEGLRQVGALCRESFWQGHHGNMDALVAAGCVQACMQVVQLHIADVEVQMRGCFALAALAHTHLASQNLIVAMGGVQVVMAAMRQHPTDEPVQRWGLRALGNLAADHRANTDAIAAAGGAALARAARRAHPNAQYVGEYARTLARLL